MTRLKRTSTVDKSYSPEFKLNVVLEYIRNPKQRKQICKTNRITEDLLTTWHEEFLARAIRVFSESPSLPIETQTPGKQPLIQTPDSSAIPQSKPAWGVRLNTGLHQSFHSPSSSEIIPSWLIGYYREEWENKRGVIIWDDQTQVMQSLWAWKALQLLGKLRENEAWRQEGIAIVEQVQHPKPTASPEVKRAGKKSKWKFAWEHAETTRESDSAFEDVDEERLRLMPPANFELFAFLQEHETRLKKMAEQDKKRAEEAMSQAYDILLRAAREHEASEIDYSARPLKWVIQADKTTLVCDLPPNRGTVVIDETNLFWEGCIEVPNEFKHSSPWFGLLEKALDWTEQELIKLEKEAREKPAAVESEPDPKPLMDLTPFEISQAALEPTQLTYRVVIQLEHVPDDFKTMEMSFGKKFYYAQEYQSPNRVGREIQLDLSQAKIEWPANYHCDTYYATSMATYYQESVAIAQAQKLWDGTRIQQLFREHRITRARYGYEEMETDYCHWLGGLEETDHPWEKQKSRAEHMAKLAMSETILNALDFDRFKARFGSAAKWLSDEEILYTLHEWRARSKFILEDARAQSEQWLEIHPEQLHQERKNK